MYPRVKTIVNGTEFNVSSKYRILKAIGAGAYGIVVSAEERATGKQVAIKKIANTFHDPLDALRIIREIKLGRFFGQHDNLVTVYDMELPEDPTNFDDIYIVTELMETDLHNIIYSKQKLTADHIAYFMYQTLRGLKYTHSANIIHRDLKPSNLKLNSNCDLRVSDFGLARGVDELAGYAQTEYIMSRWYCAPEVMLACADYTQAVDMWAVGCIFFEMMGRKPLFAGSDYMDQLKLITSVIGTPSAEDLTCVKSERALAFMARQGVKPKQEWSKILKRGNPLALDLLDRLLVFNPAKRMTVDEALAHPYFATLHCPDDEPTHTTTFDISTSFEMSTKLDKVVLQHLMYDEITALKRVKAHALLLAVRHSLELPAVLPPMLPLLPAYHPTIKAPFASSTTVPCRAAVPVVERAVSIPPSEENVPIDGRLLIHRSTAYPEPECMLLPNVCINLYAEVLSGLQDVGTRCVPGTMPTAVAVAVGE